MSNTQWNEKTTSDEVAKELTNEIKGKVVLVTGVSPNSLGADFCRAISTHEPKMLILAGRTLKNLEDTAKTITACPTRILILDLGSQRSVREAAAEVNKYEEPIDVLVNNAGVMASPWRETSEGIESQFGINHIGHFLFTKLIKNKIFASKYGGRIVNVSSNGHLIAGVRYDDHNFNGGKDYDKWMAYGQAKTANVLFSAALARKLGGKGLQAYSVHPGAIVTNLGRDMSEEEIEEVMRVYGQDQKSLAAGSATHVVAAFDPKLKDQNGAFLCDCKTSPVKGDGWAEGKDNEDKLWLLSEKLIGEKFDY